MVVNVFFSKDIHTLFSYWINRNNKFNWDKMRLKFQNMTNSGLKDVIYKIKDALENS